MADELTDEELVRELKSHGEVVKLPIKPVKRGVLIKKLNHLRVKAEKARSEIFKKPAPVVKGRRAARSPRSSIASFSSDESDIGETDSLSGKRKKAPRRVSTRLSSVVDTGKNAVSSTRNIPIRDESNFLADVPSTSGIARPKTSQRPEESTSPIIKSSISTGLSNIGKSIFPQWNKNANHNNRSFDFESSDSDVGEGSTYEVENRGTNTSLALDESDNTSMTHKSSPHGSDAVNWLRNRQPVGNSISDHPHSITPPRTSTPIRRTWYKGPENHSPVTQNSSPSVIRQQLNSLRVNHVDDAEKIADDQRLRSVFKAKDQVSKTNITQHISMFLLLIVGLFFLVLGVLYFGMKAESSEIPANETKAENNLMICTEYQKAVAKSKESKESEDQGEVVKKPCFEEAVSRLAFTAISSLYDELSHRMGDYRCEKRAEGNMTRSELTVFLDHFIQNKDIKDQKGMMYTDVVISLVIHNPHWHIRAMKADKERARDMSEAESVTHLESMVPFMSLTCRLWKAIHRVTTQILLAVAIVIFLILAGGLTVYFVHYRVKRKELEQKQVFNMVEKIIDVLKLHCETLHDEEDEKPFLAIQHVRDTLLPPSQRKQYQSIWDNAVRFVELHESRVRVETQTIHGEDFTVWRWLQNCPKGQKVWQGQAFGEDKLNHVAKSPSECLKVANMFNADKENEEDWDINVKDAILEKCIDCQIIHVHVDRGSSEGVVYVKCSDEAHAGKAFKQLHGWWFDGKLVTVKYLKVEHYSRSFPKSVRSLEPLLPTTDRKLSMAQPYHRSSLEMT